ncbi:hypothetical protein G7Z17_g1794 [Cylindrodendrum hubeiense]|uniref:Thiol-specific monooxygenase n=1 Tax=Cylindrodendrum hubeiense TaxID=595255 RepID=A0A9P5LF22_9HYPO|nr:hypothetical protein G7Z17_g1794 [Cylindrodendrum hubeiense]
MTANKRRVAVIGAGPAGIIATDALVKEQAFDTIRVFDRQDVAGGTWVLNPSTDRQIPSLRRLLEKRADQPVEVPLTFPSETPKAEKVNSPQLRYSDTGAHKNLHSNLPPSIMAFSQEPIPKVLSERTLAAYGPSSPFRHITVVREWVTGILKRGGHEHLVEYNTTVELVEKQGDEWVLTLRKDVPGESTNYWWQERFDSVVVATGHYYLPFVPNIFGLAEYAEKYPTRIVHSKHYQDNTAFKGKRVVVVGGSISAFDALHDIRLVSKLPIISSLRSPSQTFTEAAFTHPDIVARPTISAFDPDTGRITFSDDTFVDDVDVVVFATGYEFSFPFLPNVKPVNGRIPGLYQHVFTASDPSLAFLGMVTGGFGLRIFEWQAVTAARVLAGHADLPSQSDMEKWEQARVAERGDGPGFWTLLPDFENHFEALRAIAGEPAPGTIGRVLPKYDAKWAEAFWEFVNKRIEWWEKDATEAGLRRDAKQSPVETKE